MLHVFKEIYTGTRTLILRLCKTARKQQEVLEI